MANSAVAKGLASPIVTSIPHAWSAEWFRSFITNYLQNADVRNVLTPVGGGIDVTTNGFTRPATVSLTVIPNDTVFGNISGVPAGPVGLNQAQLTSLINIFSTSASGAVPASPGYATGLFLRADRTWAPVSAGNGPPSALVGLTPVLGDSVLYMSADSAPALDQSISPTWTGNHTFSPTAGTGLTVATAATVAAILAIAGNANTSSASFLIEQDGASAAILNNQANAAMKFYTNNTLRWTLGADGGIFSGTQTDEGNGSLNASGLYVAGAAVLTAATGADSITGAGTGGSPLTLVGDVSGSPGNNYFYGTNAGGTRGWYPATAGSSPLTTKGDVYVYSTVNTRLPVGTDGYILTADSTQTAGLKWAAVTGTGTVTSVGLADTSTTAIYSVTGSPVTTAGTIDITLKTQSANLVFAGPASGAAAQPTFRALVAGDLPISGANPTAKVGLTAVNGSAATYMRSDGAPPIDQSINPVWTGFQTFAGTSSVLFQPILPTGSPPPTSSNAAALVEVNGQGGVSGNNRNVYGLIVLNQGSTGTSYGIGISAGTNSSDANLWCMDFTQTHTFLKLAGDGSGILGYNGSGSTLTWNAAGNMTVAVPASGVAFTVDGGTGNDAFHANGGVNQWATQAIGSSTSGQSFGSLITAGTTSADQSFLVRAHAGSPNYFEVRGDGALLGYGPTAAGLLDMAPDQGQFTATLVGCTTAVTGTMYWYKVGQHIILFTAGTNISGTSNSASFSITGLPAIIQPAHTQIVPCALENNGTNVLGSVELTAASGTLTFLMSLVSGTAVTLASNAFTPSGTKGLNSDCIVYALF